MQYLIDGYNLLFRVNEDVNPLSDSRLEIIETLAQKVSRRRLRASVIFDSTYEQAALFPTRYFHNCLEIIYSPQGQCADKHILEKLQWVKTPKAFTVVTSDVGLARDCKQLGALVLSVEEFLVFIEKKKRGAIEEAKESPQEIERLRTIFEERFKDSQ